MKYIIILGDGMADYPIKELGNKTPLMAANTPNIDELCKKGRCGKLETVPLDMPPGSEIANMAVLGFDVKKVYQGRGVLEAASMGIELNANDMAMRCNLVCIEDEKIKNHSAGHISNEEAHELIEALQNELETDKIKFYPGVSYRHLLVLKDGKTNIDCTPPHDVPGTPFKDVMIRAKDEDTTTADILNNLIVRSQEILKNHPVNKKRIAEGKDPGNSIWPWSPGNKPEMKTLQESYGISGAMISAVDLLYGIGKYAGMKAIKVPGSTGLYNTNYEGKAKAAVDALQEVDLVYLHIEASDEAGHEGDYELKKKTIEYLDQRVVKYIMEETEKMNEEIAIALIPDHPTPCELKTHTHDPVPFIIYHHGEEPDGVLYYNEEDTKEGFYGLLKGDEFIKKLLKQ
ncbi:MAG: cofactor-independent phosphoglycerate mutase [Marinilabiliales bacterium]|nr:MAG: cofactor-independent phosphoglycerate mutase [Marinilabiliales bacterium]